MEQKMDCGIAKAGRAGTPRGRRRPGRGLSVFGFRDRHVALRTWLTDRFEEDSEGLCVRQNHSGIQSGRRLKWSQLVFVGPPYEKRPTKCILFMAKVLSDIHIEKLLEE